MAIGGASGFVGRAVGVHLQQQGYKVTAIGRKPVGRSGLTWTDIEHNGLPTDASCVINFAGKTIGDPAARWTQSCKDEVWNSRVHHTTKLLSDAIASSSQPPSLFLSCSAIGFYPPSDSKHYTETTPVDRAEAEKNWFCKLCAEWERAADAPNTRVVHLRTGIVLGRDGGMIASVFWPFYLFLGHWMGSPDHWMSWIHIDDYARAVGHIMRNSELTGPVNMVSPQPVPYNSVFVAAFARALGRPALFLMPNFIVRFLFGAERANDLILADQKILPEKLLNAKGFKFEYGTIDKAAAEFARRKPSAVEIERRNLFK